MKAKDEEKPIDVVVYDNVGTQVAQYLEEAGRPSHSPMHLQQRIQDAVWKKWGVRAKRFQDEPGGGWLVEVSEVLDGIESFAVVRSIHGTRMVVAVVDLEEMSEFEKTGQWSTPEANGLDPDLVAAMSDIERNPPAIPGRPGSPTGPTGGAPVTVQSKPGDPRLIVWWESTNKNQDERPFVEKSTYGEVQKRVLTLLMDGARVEVWEGMKKPEIQVSL